MRNIALYSVPTYHVLLYNIPFGGLSWTPLPTLILDVINDVLLHYLQTRLYLPTDWLLLHTESGLLSSYYIERVGIEQRSRAAAPDTAPDQAAEFTPQRNRSTKQNPTKVSPKGGSKRGINRCYHNQGGRKNTD